jgi:hypothetical protein
MITSFMAGNQLHAVHVIHQKGMTKIIAISLCKIEEDAGNGVYQVADWAFDGSRPKYGEIPVCSKCAGIVNSMMKEPPRKDPPK